jgi:predicted 2-oxoglutarate/Fe(II)-dependent dioxygenase YbiX
MKFLNKIPSITHTQTFIQHFHNAIPEDLCASILDNIQDHAGWDPHRWQYEKDSDNTTHSSDPECKLYTNTPLNNIIDKCINEYTKIQTQRYHEMGIDAGWEVTEFTAPRWNKYTSGNDMKYHVDHIYSAINEQSNGGVPLYSILGLITDEFEGGNFVLSGNTIPLNKGDILIWPSNFLYPHQVLPISNGTRISFVSWAW